MTSARHAFSRRDAGDQRDLLQCGLPDDFHAGAAAIYERMSQLKDLPPQALDAVVAAILERVDPATPWVSCPLPTCKCSAHAHCR